MILNHTAMRFKIIITDAHVIHDLLVGYQSNDYTTESGKPSMLHQLHKVMQQ